MNSIPVLGIPHLNRPDLLVRCIESIDYPVDHLVIVQNGSDEQFPQNIGDIAKARGVKRFTHIRHPNAGVAGSWNEIATYGVGAPFWFVVGNDIQFSPGDLKKLADAAWANHHDTAFLFGNHGHSLFVWTKHGLNKLGFFDFNVYPAYCDDTEMSMRVKLAGAKQIDVQDIHAVHGEAPSWGSSTIHSDKSLRAQNGGTHGRNWSYIEHKWGGRPGSEKYATPYNIPGAPIDYIKFFPEFRAQQQWS